ncbi:coproporphyrinogen III oxidase [Marivirga lumbricoides]|uniref:Heme chaperone HemW n=1 Tax=Marivirga lumbricoides TaxID=1046115 RepID=A0A2T4DSJ4_9BACT|nr:coproporphyrinogen III oxidase [Marivirga lumbricoides]
MAGIYIHIPFCKQACFYCDFHFSTNMALKDEMANSICEEIKLQKDYLENEKITSIYFGGGTPSLLSEKQLCKIMDTLYRYFTISKQSEITIEANPDDITPKKLADLYLAGINRLSVGVQSFDEKVLKWMNRAHDATHAHQCLKWINDSSFKNYSVDLIYGIPISTHAKWAEDLKNLTKYHPPHISSYCLTIEPNTVFGKWQKKGDLSEASEDYAAEQFMELTNYLSAIGYQHYEVSNFCLPTFESKHNSSYWQQKPYLGLGPGAHSYNGFSRQFNIANNALFIRSIKEGKLPFEKEILSRNDQINEYLMTSLRTSEGCDLDYLQHKYNYNFQEENSSTINEWRKQGLCEVNQQKIILTPEGKLLADKLAADLFLVD